MDTDKIREEISQHLEHADDRVLKIIYGLIKADQASSPVGNRAGGVGITKEQLIARAETEERDISEGRIKTSKQIRQKMKSW